MSDARSLLHRDRPTRKTCERCGWRDTPGHFCRRAWVAHLRVGPLQRFGVQRTLTSLGRGSYWTLIWAWKGDGHSFIVRPSLGEHFNHSEMHRREMRGAEVPEL